MPLRTCMATGRDRQQQPPDGVLELITAHRPNARERGSISLGGPRAHQAPGEMLPR
jgi:hypothetical protein